MGRMKVQGLMHAEVRVDYAFIEVVSGSQQGFHPGRSAGEQASVRDSGDAGFDAGGKDAKEGVRKDLDILAREDLVFVVCCLEGKCEICAACFAAEAAMVAGALTVGFAVLPPAVEDPRRAGIAKDSLAELGRHVGSLVVIPGDMLAAASGEAGAMAPSSDALMRMASETLFLGVDAVCDVCDLIAEAEDRCWMRIDFADLHSALKDGGLVRMGMGQVQGRRGAEEASRNALASPLLDGACLRRAACLIYTMVAPTTSLARSWKPSARYSAARSLGTPASTSSSSKALSRAKSASSCSPRLCATGRRRGRIFITRQSGPAWSLSRNAPRHARSSETMRCQTAGRGEPRGADPRILNQENKHAHIAASQGKLRQDEVSSAGRAS